MAQIEADLWVLDRTPRILFGEVGQVVKGDPADDHQTRRTSGDDAGDLASRSCRIAGTTLNRMRDPISEWRHAEFAPEPLRAFMSTFQRRHVSRPCGLHFI